MKKLIFSAFAALLTLPGLASAQDPVPSAEALHGVYPKQDHYSPYANRNFPTNVYWGDTHVHTGISMDGGAFGLSCRAKTWGVGTARPDVGEKTT